MGDSGGELMLMLVIESEIRPIAIVAASGIGGGGNGDAFIQ